MTEPIARFSKDRRYRYTLRRDTGVLGAEGSVLFVMLNPSIADETRNDPTVRRCLGYASDWGYARLLVGNAYAYRATDPRALREVEDPVGYDNDLWLRQMAGRCQGVVVAWGTHIDPDREREVVELLEFHAGTVDCLGQTKNLHPKHPLYLRADARREPFRRIGRTFPENAAAIRGN